MAIATAGQFPLCDPYAIAPQAERTISRKEMSERRYVAFARYGLIGEDYICI